MKFEKEKHVQFLLNSMKDKESSQYIISIPIRMNTYYWVLTCLYLLDSLDRVNKEEIIEFIIKCQNKDGGFGGNIGYDSNIHSSLSAVYCLILFDSLEKINVNSLISYVFSLLNEDGSFKGNSKNEVDTRFTYCSLSILSLLNQINLIYKYKEKIIQWLLRCENFDSGFGCFQGCESHSGQIFTVVGSLSILNSVNVINQDSLGFWLYERQTSTGGFNGRQEKTADVCYSWWVGASLKMIKRQNWINVQNLQNFILSSQDLINGGISDKPKNNSDPYHTFFGCAGLSLINFPGIKEIDPIYALPKDILKKHFSKINS